MSVHEPTSVPLMDERRTDFVFAPASKRESKARVALSGPAGSGKTFSALAIAEGLGPRVAVIDTERGSARKYARDPFAFDVVELESFAPAAYIRAIAAAAAARYDVLVIDSLSHAWSGKDGALEEVSRRQGNSANAFTAWRAVTPAHNALVDEILGAPLHVIATLRVKTSYVIEPDERGKMVPRKVGLAPIQRAGTEYEFDVVGELDGAHTLRISKTRYRALDGATIARPGRELGEALLRWLSEPGSTSLAGQEPIGAGGAAAPTPDAAAPISATSLRVIVDCARDAGEIAGKQTIAEFCRARGYDSWQDFVNRGAADAPALIVELQQRNRRWRSA